MASRIFAAKTFHRRKMREGNVVDGACTMTSPESPPGWGDDTLTRFIDDVRHNQFANFRDKKALAGRLSAIDRVFARVADDWSDAREFVEANLFARCHGAFRAASATALSGQMFETSVLVRSCLEHAGYAALMKQQPALVGIWMNRQQDEASLKATKKAFTQTNVRAAVAATDSRAAPIYDELYQQCVDLGAHPNIWGLAASTTVEKIGATKRVVRFIHLHGDGVQLDWALSFAARGGMCGLSIFEGIFPERFKKIGIKLTLVDRN